MKESKLDSKFGKLKYEENLNDSIYESEKKNSLITTTPFFSTFIVQDFQDSSNDEEDKSSSQEYLNDIKKQYQERALLANPSQQKPKLRPNKYFKAKYNKVKAKLALLSPGTSSKSSMVKNKGLVDEAYECDEEDMSSNDNDMTEVKVLMALADDENVVVSIESAKNGEWVKISMRKCISEQIPSQKKIILGLDQLIEDPSNSRQTDLVFVKSSVEHIKVSIPGVERPSLSEAEGFTLPNHNTGRILLAESQVKIIDPSVAITNSSAIEYDSAQELKTKTSANSDIKDNSSETKL
ncbi:hypothetical protein Tco_1362843 [Tanacetum coccineum]